jgi:predicted metal-dependent peptidase
MEIIQKAKEHLILHHPFFAYLSLQIEFIEDSTVDKTSIDGVVFRYNPKFIKSIDVRGCAALIAHAMSHVLLLHPLRAEHKDIHRWDKACDYAVNTILKDSHIPLMNDLYDPKYDNVPAEDIYELLEEESEEKGNDSNSSAANQMGEDNSGNGVSSGPEESDSNSGGDEQKQEEMDGSDICGVEPPLQPGVSDQEQEQRIMQKIMDAAMQAEFSGTQLTAAIKTVINALKEPKKDWREILFKFTAELARNDYDWEMPDLIYLQRNIYIPSLHSIDIGGIVFAIDTSASINDELLKTFLSELKEAAEQITKEITVLHCDTEIRKVEEVLSEEIDSIVPEGRGNTKFSPVFKYIEENDLNPKALIYFTDGKCWETLKAPDYPVIWCIYENKNFVPQFGESINVDK